MSKKNFIQVFEYQKLKYDDNPLFKKQHFDAMVLFNEKNNNKYFTIVHKGVLFNSYVGVIQIGGLTIEILPKADNSNNPNKDIWQNVLLNMLKICKHISIDNISETGLKKRYNSILDAYFEVYLAELEQLVKNGLIKKYGRVQDNQLALKGKLLFTQNIQKNIIHKERFYCEHQVYDKNHLMHQILFKGLIILKSLMNNSFQDRINRVLLEFCSFKELNINKSHFEKINISKKEEPYLKALDIAKMIILNYSPSLKAGQDNMLTLLFDMNKLWEEYIYRILYKYKPQGYNVSYQNSDKFWEHKTIRPDIIITTDNAEVIIIDTKWKVVNSNNPADDDLKQMFAYNIHWKSMKSMLLYPKINQEDSSFGNYKFLHSGLEKNQCKLGFVSVLEKNTLKNGQQISRDILNKLHIPQHLP